MNAHSIAMEAPQVEGESQLQAMQESLHADQNEKSNQLGEDHDVHKTVQVKIEDDAHELHQKLEGQTGSNYNASCSAYMHARSRIVT